MVMMRLLWSGHVDPSLPSCSSQPPLLFVQKIVRRRPDLRIIISSATIEAEHFARFFNHPTARFPPEKRAHGAMRPLDSQHPSPQSALLSVEGRTHHVQVRAGGSS